MLRLALAFAITTKVNGATFIDIAHEVMPVSYTHLTLPTT